MGLGLEVHGFSVCLGLKARGIRVRALRGYKSVFRVCNFVGLNTDSTDLNRTVFNPR